jgi:hypothetical protein
MKIYLATSGCYSDYSVHQAFKNEEDAEAYIDGMYDGHVEEYELWDDPVKKRKHWYLEWQSFKRVFSRVNGGLETRDVEPEPLISSWTEDAVGVLKLRVVWETMEFGGRTLDRLTVHGPSEEAVLKVFSEQRAQYLARKEGIS